MNRRSFLAGTVGLLGSTLEATPAPMPIIDTHIHLFDTRRPQGVPWPDKRNAILYQPALPSRYRNVTRGMGIVGAIEVECSPWLEDNQWVLDVAANDTILVGTIGHLEPGGPDFRAHLERFHRNPLFRGIRNGDLWSGNLDERLSRAAFISDLKFFADAGMVLEVMLDSDPALLPSLIRLKDQIPDLRIVIDHLPHVEPPTDAAARRTFMSNLRELGGRPQVHAKFSEVRRRVDGRVPADLNFYRPWLDELYAIFGEDRALYASDWPNSDPLGLYPQVLSIIQSYMQGKSQLAKEKFFWMNSAAAYRWVKRAPTQPEPRVS